MSELTDHELGELKRKAIQSRRRRSWVYRLLAGSDLNGSYWVPLLVDETQRARHRCAQLEQDCAQLQREYDALRYGPASPAAQGQVRTR